MTEQQEAYWEREARVLRNGSVIGGLGAIALGSEGSPRLMALGVLTLIGSAACEGVRRLAHRFERPEGQIQENTQV